MAVAADREGAANVAKVTMPQLGESVAEGTIGKWLKQPGDHVAKYEPLVEVVTDKVNAEVPSPFEGILREILVEEGATVPNNAEIAVIETADDGARRCRRHRADGPGRHAPSPPTAAASDLRRPRLHRRRAAAPHPGRRRRSGGERRAWPTRDGRRGVRIAGRHGHRNARSAARDRRSRRADDPGRPSPPARARPLAGADLRDRWWRPDHPRGRAQGRRDHPDRWLGTGRLTRACLRAGSTGTGQRPGRARSTPGPRRDARRRPDRLPGRRRRSPASR